MGTCVLASCVLIAAACTGVASEMTDDSTVGGKADGGDLPFDVPWSVNRHIWPPGINNDSRELFQQDLDLIAGLGARLIRTDVWWYIIEPQPGVYDEDALAHYRWAVAEAKARGLDMLINLSNPPEWAKDLLKDDKVRVASEAFAAYSAKVAATVGLGDVRYYQIWNEPNHMDNFSTDTDIALLVAGRRGLAQGLTSIGLAELPIRTMVNVMIDGHDIGVGPSWESDLEYMMEHGARDAIDILGIDHYPGTFDPRGWEWSFLDRLFRLGERYNKAVAILETGYSTARCSPPFTLSEAGQAVWARVELTKIRLKLKALMLLQGGVKFELANFHRLEDRQTSNCFNVEDFFGVVRKDRSLKPAYHVLQEEIAKF